MRRIFAILLLLASSFVLGASTFYPARYTGTDFDKIQKAYNAAGAVPGSTVDFDTRSYTWDKTIHVWAKEPSYLCVNTVASGYWAQMTYTGEGPAIVFHNLKDSTIAKFRIRGGGLVFTTDGSSSRNDLISVRVQGAKDVGFKMEAVGNADMSVFNFTNCEATECPVGFQFVGANNLGPLLTQCTATHCTTGFDFGAGGSGFRAIGCGGSFTETLWAINGGFQFQCWAGESELCGTVYRIGGDGLAGFGQDTVCKIDDMEHRSIKTLLATINKAGTTKFSVLKVSGSAQVELRNKSTKTAVFDGFGVSPDVKEGLWKVIGAVAI